MSASGCLRPLPDSARPMARQLLRGCGGWSADSRCPSGPTWCAAVSPSPRPPPSRCSAPKGGWVSGRPGQAARHRAEHPDPEPRPPGGERPREPRRGPGRRPGRARGLTAAGHRVADRLESQEEDFAGEILARIPSERRARVVEALDDLLRRRAQRHRRLLPRGVHALDGGLPGGTGGAQAPGRGKPRRQG